MRWLDQLRSLWNALIGTRHRRMTLVIGGVLALSLPAYVWVLFNAIEFTGPVAIPIFVAIGLGLWVLFDWAVEEIDTIRSLQYEYVERRGQVFQESPNFSWAFILGCYLILLGLMANAAAG